MILLGGANMIVDWIDFIEEIKEELDNFEIVD